jgi:Spy/CpxP family protein refolding chaperone
MNRSKGYALMFLLGAFVAGGAFGFTADRVMGGRHGHEGGSRGYRQRMAEELKLTPAQQASVDSLIDQKHRQILALYTPVQPELDSIAIQARVISDSTHAQIKRLLNPEQQVKFDNMRVRARKDLADRRARDSVSGKLRNRPPKSY